MIQVQQKSKLLYRKAVLEKFWMTMSTRKLMNYIKYTNHITSNNSS